MNLVNHLFSHPGIRTLGWTLIHSLWQGAAIALAFFLLMLLFRRSRAQTRYVLGVFMLGTMLVTSLVTMNRVYRSESAREAAIAVEATGQTLIPAETGAVTDDFWMAARTFFDRGLPLIVSVWFLGSLFFLFRFAGGILYGRRLRYHYTRNVSRRWRQKVGTLCRKIRVRSRVVIRESLITRIPMTIGHLKPMIIFPAGMLIQLPPDQVEALIVHELAHILRRDYIVNVFQGLMEILYFYHPGIRWINSQIRNEREHCCDDMTVAALKDRITYARALTRVGECAVGERETLAMAASGKTSQLFQRIRRLVPMKPKSSRFIDGMIGAAVMAVFVLSMVAGITASSRLFAVSSGEPMVKAENHKEDVKKLEHRYQELYSRRGELTDGEKKELEEIAGKLKAIQEKNKQERIHHVKSELRRLKEKDKLTAEEKEKYEKYSQFLMQYELELKERYLEEEYKKLKIREENLKKEELKKLKAIEKKLKSRQLEEQEKQKMMTQRVLDEYRELKAREDDLNEKERQQMKEAELYLRKMKEKARYEQQLRKNELRILKEEYGKLRKIEEPTQEQKEKLKKLRAYFDDMKARYGKLKKKNQVLEKKIQYLQGMDTLTEEQQKELQELISMQKKVVQELELYH